MKEKWKIRSVNVGYSASDCLIFGRGETPLVILPGLSVTPVMKQAKQIVQAYACFCEDYTVYLIDRRKDVPEGYVTADMARDTFAVTDALGLEQFALYGVSQGGMIAQQMAIDRPGAILRLVLASTLPHAGEEVGKAVGKWLSEAEKGNKRALIDAFVSDVYSPAAAKKLRPAFRMAAPFITKKQLGRFARLARASEGFSTVGKLGAVTCPALVLGAENDRVTGADASRALANELGCGIYLYPAPYGHAVYDEAPDFKDRILAFLNK